MADTVDYEPGGYPVGDFHLFLREMEVGGHLTVAEMVAKFDITEDTARRGRTMARRRGVPVTWKKGLKQFFGVAKIVYDHFRAKNLAEAKGYLAHNLIIRRGMLEAELAVLHKLREREDDEDALLTISVLIDAGQDTLANVERTLEVLARV